jgi:hypothetical protein
MTVRKIKIPAFDCTCLVCGHRWVSIAPQPPISCGSPKCRSRQWNGVKKKPARVPKIKLPAPRKKGRPRTITAMGVYEE